MLESKGFTIVEVLVALLILVVGLLGTLSTFSAATRLLADGHSYIENGVRASELLEFMRVDGCGRASVGSNSGGVLGLSLSTEEIGPDLRIVTVVVDAVTVRSRADTFSAVIPC